MAMKKEILKENNFDFLRLLFASLVIVSHSYPLTGKGEYFEFVTNGQLSLGSFSVECFFIMSGYLIYISLQNSKNIFSYLWKRVLRIFPALVGLVFVTGLILSFVSSNPRFFISKHFLSYSIDVLSLYNVRYRIGNIFSTNPYPYAINGSLWSLCYEFSMYLLVALFFWFRKTKFTLYILASLFIISSALYLTNSSLLKNSFMIIKLDITQLYKLAAYFLAGSLLTYLDLKKYNTAINRSVLFAILVLSLIFNCFKEVALFALPIFILFVANISTPFISTISKKILRGGRFIVRHLHLWISNSTNASLFLSFRHLGINFYKFNNFCNSSSLLLELD
jgi:peptidoglycan/LPS O-acetylase OafA/YrhL